MQRANPRGNQSGGSAQNKGQNVAQGNDKTDKSKDDKGKQPNNKANDPKKPEPVKGKAPVQPEPSPKREREDDNAQNRKKVKTTVETAINPITEFGQKIIDMLKGVYDSIFVSKGQ